MARLPAPGIALRWVRGRNRIMRRLPVDMRENPGETKNLYASRSNVVRRLATQLRGWGEEQGDALAVELGRRSEGG